jgi:DNA polymerase I
MSPVLNFYGQHTASDPTRRAYLAGSDAVGSVVRAAAEAATVAVDIETAGLDVDAFTLKVIIIATSSRSYVLDASDPRHVMAAREAMTAASELAFHKSAFDVPPLVVAGAMPFACIDKVVDTLVYARMALTGERHDRRLGGLETRYLGGALRAASKDNLAEWGAVNKLSKAAVFRAARYGDPIYTMYAGWDGILTAMLLPHVRAGAYRQLTEHPFGRYGADADTARELMEREQRVNRVMLRRAARGIRVDPDRISTEQEFLRISMHTLEATLARMGVSTATNRNELAAVLERDHAFPEHYPRTPTGKWSTKKEHIVEVDHPAVRAFREHSDASRLFGYLETARKVASRCGGRIHPEVNVLHARTGRTSYSNPALHQFTPEAQEVMLADETDSLVSLDWASFEPVIAANLAGDTAVIERFECGEKVYTPIVEYSGIAYTDVKVLVLAMLYGQRSRSLAARMKVDIATAKDWQRRVGEALPRTRRLMEWAAAWAYETGKTWTLSGRIVDVDPEHSYKGANYLVQGSQYDALAEAVVECDRRGLTDPGLYMTRHDEMVVSAQVADEVNTVMCTPPARLCELVGRTPVLRTDMAVLGDRFGDAEYRIKKVARTGQRATA